MREVDDDQIEQRERERESGACTATQSDPSNSMEREKKKCFRTEIFLSRPPIKVGSGRRIRLYQ